MTRNLLPLLVLALLFIPAVGQAASVAPRVDAPSAKLLVPYFEVDFTSGQGRTTLFAVRNESNDPTTVEVRYYETNRPNVPQRTDEVQLAGKAIYTRNVRDVDGLLRDADDHARGYVIIEGDAASLSGDYFQLDRQGNFAQGDRLVNVDPESPHNELCRNLTIRFFKGGDFDGGGTITVWAQSDVPVDVSQQIAFYRVYDEAGELVFSHELFAGALAFQISVDDLALPPPAPAMPAFGALEIELADLSGDGGVAETAGHVAVSLTALDRFSVGVKAVCNDAGTF